MYSIKCIDTWSRNWVKNNWKNAKGEPVKNKEIIMDILNYKKDIEKENIEINFKHIFSHTKCPEEKDSLQYFLWKGNDIVDKNIILFLKADTILIWCWCEFKSSLRSSPITSFPMSSCIKTTT
jgi:hypothetical protein